MTFFTFFKQDFCNLFASFIRKSCLRDISDVPVVIANDIETWFVTDQYIEKLFQSIHKEADTRMALHALYRNTNAVIVSKDDDELVLLVYTFVLKNITSRSCMKTDNDKFIEVGKIVEYYGKNVIQKLLHIHAVTGCDTTSYLHSVEKIKVFKKSMNSKEKMNLLQDTGVPSTIDEKTVGKVSKFIQNCATLE